MNLIEILKLIADDKLQNGPMVSEMVGTNRYVAFVIITSKSRSISINFWQYPKLEPPEIYRYRSRNGGLQNKSTLANSLEERNRKPSLEPTTASLVP